MNGKEKILFLLDPGVADHAGQDHCSAENLERDGDLPEQDGGENSRRHRFAELGGGDEGW